MRGKILVCLGLAAITLAVYWPVRHFGLIEFDDPEFVREKGEITNGLTWPGFQWALVNPVAANWHPVTTLSHMLDCQVFGRRLGAHHLVSVAVHALNGVLLFLLLMRLTGAFWRSALVAAIFAWHPLRVESVAWIAERKDMLSAFFGLLCLFAYARFVEKAESRKQKAEIQKANWATRAEGPSRTGQPKFEIRNLVGWYALALFFFALSLMSKPMLVTLPFLLVLLDYWPLRRFELSTLNSQPSTIWWEKGPFVALSAAVCGITLYLQKGGMPSLTSISLHDRVANAIVSYVQYLAKLVWPARLAIIYPHPSGLHAFAEQWPDWQVGLIALLLLAVSALCLSQAGRRPYLAVGWFWYLGTMVPVIGLVQVGEQAMADRYTYLPLIGPTISLVWLFTELFASRTKRLEGNPLGAPASLPARSQPHANAGRDAGAPSISWQANSAVVPALISVSLLAACCLLTHRQLGYWRDTVALFSHAAAVTANNSTAEFFVGLGLEKQGELAQAMVHYRTALAINPYEEQAHYNLAQLLRKSGHWQAAAEHYVAALRLRPADSKSRLNLANVLPHLGRAKEAVILYGEVLQTDPDSIEAANNLAWLLATTGEDDLRNGPRAVQLAQHACELTQFKMTTPVGTLAAAYAEAGQFADAVATVEKACSLAAASGEPELLHKNQELLDLYRAGRPFHEPQFPPPIQPDRTNHQRN